MSDIEKLASKRLDKIASSKDVSPLDLLRAAAHDVETGATKCDGVLIVFLNRPKDEAWEHSTYRANLSYDQELTALELTRYKCLRRWLEE